MLRLRLGWGAGLGGRKGVSSICADYASTNCVDYALTFVIGAALLLQMKPDKIRQVMKRLGMKKQEFAIAVGVSDRTVDGWLSKRPPSRFTERIIGQLVERYTK